MPKATEHVAPMRLRKWLLPGLLYAGLLAICRADDPLALPCGCTDVDARVAYDAKVEYSCWDQMLYGKCNDPFMFKTIKEVPEGYCQITCGRCKCCPTLAEAAKDAGLSEFLWAVSVTGQLSLLQQPGFHVAVLAPNDDAVRAGLQRMGADKGTLEKDDHKRGLLTEVVKYHIVNPNPEYIAVYSTPFLSDGVELGTMQNGTIKVYGSGDGAKLQSPAASAQIKRGNMYACKGFIHIIDSMLFPWDPSSKFG